MFSHLNTDEEDNDDGLLSLHELYDLEHDRNEKCIKPFLDKCDGDKDIFISPKEWCNCFNFNKLCAVGLSGVSNCGSPASNSIPSNSNNNNLDDEEDGDKKNEDDEDDDVDSSSGDGVDGDLEI